MPGHLERRWHTILAALTAIPARQALAALRHQATHCDGFPARGEPGRSGNPGQSPVEQQVLNPHTLAPVRDMDRIAELFTHLEQHQRDIARILGRYTPPPDTVELCEAAGYYGRDEGWAPNVPCQDIIEYNPGGTPRRERLCPKHRKQRDRWHRAHPKHDQD